MSLNIAVVDLGQAALYAAGFIFCFGEIVVSSTNAFSNAFQAVGKCGKGFFYGAEQLKNLAGALFDGDRAKAQLKAVEQRSDSRRAGQKDAVIRLEPDGQV